MNVAFSPTDQRADYLNKNVIFVDV